MLTVRGIIFAAALLLTTCAQAQITWAVPDGGGGFMLNTPRGLGRATPDGGGGSTI